MSDSSAAGAPTTTATTTSSGGQSSNSATPNSETGTTVTQPTPSSDWTSGFNDEMKGYVQNKGFRGPQDVLESYRNFEKLHGVPQERILKIPDNIDLNTPEGRSIFERLGAPKDAKEYKIDIPKEFGDEKLANDFRDVAHKAGFTHKQLETLLGWWNQRSANSVKAQMEGIAAQGQQQEANLKNEWGNAFEQNMNIARSAVQNMGWKKEQVDAIQGALGYDGVMKLLHQLGTATGEAQFVTGGHANNGVLAPNQAQSRINELMADQSFIARLRSGDAEAKRTWDNVNKMAYPGTISL